MANPHRNPNQASVRGFFIARAHSRGPLVFYRGNAVTTLAHAPEENLLKRNTIDSGLMKLLAWIRHL